MIENDDADGNGHIYVYESDEADYHVNDVGEGGDNVMRLRIMLI